jgi:hypothetical protein
MAPLAVIKELLRRQKAAGLLPLPSYIDCRAGGAFSRSLLSPRLMPRSVQDYRTPSKFAANFRKSVRDSWRIRSSPLRAVTEAFFAATERFASASLTSPSFGGASLGEAVFSRDAPLDLNDMFSAFEALAARARAQRESFFARNPDGTPPPWPALIIDEANQLRSWDESTLNQLLAYFERICKQEGLAHVVLATSDTGLTQWLQERSISVTVLEIGNFGLKEAEEYFRQHVLSARSCPPCSPDDWALIYEVCGGNATALNACASWAAISGSWAAGTAHCSLTDSALAPF